MFLDFMLNSHDSLCSTYFHGVYIVLPCGKFWVQEPISCTHSCNCITWLIFLNCHFISFLYCRIHFSWNNYLRIYTDIEIFLSIRNFAHSFLVSEKIHICLCSNFLYKSYCPPFVVRNVVSVICCYMVRSIVK